MVAFLRVKLLHALREEGIEVRDDLLEGLGGVIETQTVERGHGQPALADRLLHFIDIDADALDNGIAVIQRSLGRVAPALWRSIRWRSHRRTFPARG